mmetsp:Transcript_11965/g.15090  ORF Transcript_11965/g.15090 Transcript_11965/m.15090 type:complete len:486 (-) Transcript_11965:395-1852(-)
MFSPFQFGFCHHLVMLFSLNLIHQRSWSYLVKTPYRAYFPPRAVSIPQPIAEGICPSRRHGFSTKASGCNGGIPEDVQRIIEQIYEKETKVSITGTGSGGTIFGWLLAVPGCSSSVLSAEIPYSMAATKHMLEKSAVDLPNSGFCSQEVAIALAKKAHSQCAQLQMLEGASDPRVGLEGSVADLGARKIIGVGYTASVVSSRPKRGSHRCHVATYTADQGAVYYNLELSKGDRNRYEEDVVVSRLVLRALANATDVDIPSDFLSEGLLTEEGKESVPEGIHVGDNDALEQLYEGYVSTVLQVPVLQEDGDVHSERIADIHPFPPGTIVYPGSFNPLHEGHISLLKTAQRFMCERSGGKAPCPPIVFEIAAFNADKPPLDKEVLESRLEQFTNVSIEHSWNVVVTKVPLFIEKARLFPNCTFVIGADTVTRLIDPKYYHDDQLEMINALSEIQVLGCKFIVGGRKINEDFVTMEDVLLRTHLPQKN